MTNSEFQDWLAFHRATFTGFSAWLAKLPEKSESEPTRYEVLRSWYFVLRPCELADCRAATEAMAAGKVEEPRGYDRHKTVIRKEADRIAADRRRRSVPPRRQHYDGEQAVKCLDCMDEGVIWIYHPESVQDAMNGRLKTIYTSVVRCECAAGDLYKDFPTYRNDVFCRLKPGLTPAKHREELLTWCQHQRTPIPEGF